MFPEFTNQELLEVIKERLSSYAFFSRMYREEVTSALLSELAESHAFDVQAKEAGTEVFGAFIDKLKGADLERTAAGLAAEYAGLFLNAGKHPVFPYESVYTSQEGLLMQKARDEVLREYQQHGLTRGETFNEPEDHLAIELEFMAFLCRKTIEVLQNDDQEQGIAYLEKQKEFLEQHLLTWCPRFCQDLERAAESDFYRGIAQLTRGFLDSESESLGSLIRGLSNP
jgi:anaerobic sulfite reductase subunit A